MIGAEDTDTLTAPGSITAVIVNYNSRGHLSHCLERLTLQLGAHDEAIVVDNASSDGSQDHVYKRYPNVRLIALPQNVGFGAANNRGAQAARGEYLLLLNPDAWLADGSLEILRYALDRDETLGLAAPQIYYPDGRLQFTWAPTTGVLGEAVQKLRNPFEGRAWNHFTLPRLWRLVGDRGWYTAACLLVRREAFEAIGGFDPEIFLYFEDVDFCLRLRSASWRLGRVARAQAFHEKGGSQGGRPEDLHYRGGQLHYYRKHRPRWEVRLLERRLRRKFRKIGDEERRARLLALLDSGR